MWQLLCHLHPRDTAAAAPTAGVNTTNVLDLGPQGTFQAGPRVPHPLTTQHCGHMGQAERNATFRTAVKNIVCEEVVFIIFGKIFYYCMFLCVNVNPTTL